MSSDIVPVHEVVDPSTLLSPSELAFFGFLNRARTQPAEFAQELEALGQYYEGTSFKYPGEVTLITKEGKAAFDEALSFLQSAKPVRQLALSAGLTAASQDHVGDHFTKNLVGTTGSDGADSLNRANRYGEWSLLCGESIGYGEADPFRALAALIIDDGLATRSHRGMIFTDDFELVGLASGAHKKFGNQWVILFARSFVEDAVKFSTRSPKLRKAYAQARSKGFEKHNQSLTVSKVRVKKEGSGGGGGSRCLIL